MTKKILSPNYKIKNGFTLIELLVVLGIIVILAAVVLPIGFNFYQLQILNKTGDQTVWLLKQARSNAISQKNDSSFGLCFINNDAILFQGDSCASRQLDQDIVLPIPASIVFSGMDEVIFLKGSGNASQIGKIILSQNKHSREIEINQLGVISY